MDSKHSLAEKEIRKVLNYKTWITGNCERQYDQVMRAPELWSGGPMFKSFPDHQI